MSVSQYYVDYRIEKLEKSLRSTAPTPTAQLPYTPEAWGGVADGVIDPITGSVSGTDNRTAIQNCLATYGKCFLGEGIYAISYFVPCTNPTAYIYAESRDRTTLALLDNTNLDHDQLLGWGTFHPDCILVGSAATDVRIENITFDNNGRNRRVGNKAGYTEPHSCPISWTGHGQKVRFCRFKNLQAAGGSTSSARTPEFPEAFCLRLTEEPTVVGNDELGEWVEVDGASVTDCEFLGPLCPQTDPYDFGLTATPEITFILVQGLSVSWKYGTGTVSGSTLTTATNFFESWMEGKPASLGDEWQKNEHEKIHILSVDSPTQATLSVAPSGTWTNAQLRVLKRTRKLYTNGEISRNTFKELKIWRTTDTDKQIRALHGVTCVDCRGYRIEENRFLDFDGVAVYMDNAVIMDMSIARNTGIKCLYGIGPGMADFALTCANGSGWWKNIYITDNVFQHGLGEFARLYYVMSIKYGSADEYRMTSLMGGFADGVVVGIPVYDRDDMLPDEANSNFTDFFQPATVLIRAQTHCIENMYWTGNNLQVVDDLYTRLYHLSFWDSNKSINWIFITDNVFDMLTWNPAGDGAWLHVEDSQVLTTAYYGPQIRVGYNYRSYGNILSLWDVAANGQIYPQLSMSSPNGFTRDVPFRLNNLTIGAAFNTIGPDVDGYLWWATDQKENNGVNQRYSDIEWAGDGSFPLKLVFPKPTTNYDLSSGEVRAGTQFRFINNSSVAATVDLYWDKAGIPTLILAAVPVGDIVHMTVDSDGYRYQQITPTSGKST